MFDWVFPGSVDEKTLIEKAKTNHHDFGRLYDRFVDVVYRFVRRHVAHEQDAEDIVSDVFMAVALKIGQYETTREQKFTTRLLAIAKYKLADHRRAVYTHPEQALDDFPEP
jgi:DNA-directed RNA polymerase specialized sigma24 family protein